MVPLILPLVLLVAQSGAVAVALLRGLWRSTPAWTVYVCVATVHLIVGLALVPIIGSDYPLALVYLEPLILIGQIAFAFESCLKYLQVPLRGGSPESRLLLWLIPLVPTALILPVEIGFVQDALASWHSQERDALALLYALRRLLSITLLVILAVVPFIAKARKIEPQATIRFHHFVLSGYLLCSVVGFFGKQYLSNKLDLVFTIAFFLAGPTICFAVWAGRMWKARPEDLRVQEPQPEAGDAHYQRHGIPQHP